MATQQVTLPTPKFQFQLSSLVLVAALLFMAHGGMLLIVALVLSIALHECAHALTAWMFNVPVKGCGANWKGAFIRREQTSGWRESLISVAGPMVNVALAVMSTGTLRTFNVALAIVCLLPIKGTDGYRAFKAI